VKSLTFSREVQASPEVAWSVVSDLAAFGDAAPGLSRVEVSDDPGQGMRRRCYDSRGRGWDEVCTLWEEGHRYEMRVRTETYPFPLRQMFRAFKGAWEVEPAGGGVLVSMRYGVEPSALGLLLWPAIRPTFARQCEQLLDNWQRRIELTEAPSSS
jgi:hypothetical protein